MYTMLVDASITTPSYTNSFIRGERSKTNPSTFLEVDFIFKCALF